ncbi:hypothetical protein CRX67_03895 [Enterobacteriaceae bacterium A-F18]|nr:hypothetical protein CRX67_03895 [Enterobacteriaceae bacterium A-F18]
MKDETLLPCPFCGSPAEYYPDGGMEGYSIMCSRQNGPCNMLALGYETPEEAERAWNTRATLQSGNSEAIQDFLRVLDEYPEQLVPINRNSAVVRALRNAAGGNSAQPVTVPDGYVLVPVEPTPEMLTASYVFAHIDNTADSWKAMLASAPKGV